jgi:hypothetical protein
MSLNDPGCVKTSAIGFPSACAATSARIWRTGGGEISRIEPSELLWPPEVI